jgi:hypothetical protein
LRKSIQNRIEDLERRLGPKHKKGPLPVFTRHVRDETPEEFQARLRALGATEGTPIFIMGRPGDSLFDKEDLEENAECEAGLKKLKESGDEERAFVIEVVHIKKAGPRSRRMT